MDAKISSQNQNQNKELKASSTLYQQFKLPDEWVVERRCRSKRGNRRSHNDKYYYEPGTRQRFRSLISVQEHLSGETSKISEPGNKKNMQIVPYIFKSHSLFNLPDGWIIEKKLRKNMDYAGIIDKHYIELETGKRFRSLRSVEKYLTEGKELAATLEALEAGDHVIPSKSSGSGKENFTRKKVSMPGSSSVPAKIKWVLSGPGGIVWNPFMDDFLVPESIKQKWSETFVFSLIDRLMS